MLLVFLHHPTQVMFSYRQGKCKSRIHDTRAGRILRFLLTCVFTGMSQAFVLSLHTILYCFLRIVNGLGTIPI